MQRRLKKVLVSAYLHVPYYRETMQAVGYDPLRDYCGPKDLRRLPVTTRQVVQTERVAAFAKEGIDLSRCFKDITSGSTGVPLIVYRGNYEHAVQVAKWHAGTLPERLLWPREGNVAIQPDRVPGPEQ